MNDDTQNNESSILDYIHVIVYKRWMIIRTVILAGLIALVTSLLLPKEYQARATILPPEEKSSMQGLGALLANSPIPLGDFGLSSGGTNSEIFEEILNSRYIAERLINQFKLKTLYEVSDTDKAVQALRDETSISTEKSGMIIIEVTASTAQLAADLANKYVNELDNFNREHNITSAKSTRIFIETRLLEAQEEMRKALSNLQTFQETNQLISLPEQAEAAVQAAATIEAQLRLMNFELATKRNVLSPNHPEIVQIQMQINEMQKQLNRIRFGSGTNGELSTGWMNTSIDFHLAFAQVPALQKQLGQLMMDAKIQQTIVELLLQQYEQAKIKEVHDTPTVRRLDVATPPASPSAPRVVRIVAVTTIMALVFSILMAFLMNYTQNLNSNDEIESIKYGSIKSLLRADYSRIISLIRGNR